MTAAANTMTEADIRPPAIMEAKRACVEADRDHLLARRAQWVEVACPACGGDDRRPWGEKQGFTYAECGGCGTVYTTPRPSAEVLETFYATSENYAYWNQHVFPATEDVRRERIFRPRAERLADIARRHGVVGGTLLDVGAAFGTFCRCAIDAGLATRAIALEPTPGLAETCRQRGLEVIEQPLEVLELPDPVDILTAYEVIEHVFDPGVFLDRCRTLLRPGGLLVVSCPNIRGFGIAELGVASGSVDHEHLNYFHPASLAGLLEARGFTVLESLTPGRLDADLVRQAAARGEVDLADRPLLQEILQRRWEELGEPFQDFLARHGLSSHLWMVARRPPAD
jgi:2-polyprenyl-3-methyl-5-hydroxy-6-metoxy-1,4-benzoquinol methylase